MPNPDKRIQPIRVLVIDDDKQVRDLFRGFLSAPQFEILDRASAADLALLMSEEHIDVVISDIMMPEVDGFSVSRAIKDNPATTHIPVFLLSGIDDPRVRLTALSAGADHCAAKPFDLDELRARIINAARMKRLFDQFQGRGARPE